MKKLGNMEVTVILIVVGSKGLVNRLREVDIVESSNHPDDSAVKIS